MYEYIKGILVEATPAYVVVECGGIGYNIHVSLNTYTKIASARDVLLYIHQVIREDVHLFYGFFSKEERSLFRSLISVSGIGANTANVMLSSMSVEEITGAIMTENVNAIKSVKGIGVKTAQRVIIELKDKVGKEGVVLENMGVLSNTMKEEALSALVMLGFARVQVGKTLDKICTTGKVDSVEELIKLALKQL
ncbi:Holliday junction branch migration protein RuvA [uncultured Sanguibacteroides sp.]|uniref:Holliday junction branch migration protein RuvA n=1 Tax=uncultured Sanguibacteroides sp. TaxID=1635151 RepID=UPI0025D77EB6|nr:Holliday junction branch migration protein RuvA [uncultured Sanguibacteroides sp.]